MVKIIIGDGVVKGYHIFQIRPPPNVYLPVTNEYGNEHDENACLVWVPRNEAIPQHMVNVVTDQKRGKTVLDIVGFPIGRVPEGFFNLFTKLRCQS